MEEKWKDIPGYEGIYQESTLGRIKISRIRINFYYKNRGIFYEKIRKLLLLVYDERLVRYVKMRIGGIAEFGRTDRARRCQRTFNGLIGIGVE